MTSKASLTAKRKFAPVLHEMLWTVRRYWWVAVPGMLLFSLLTFVGKRFAGDRPDAFTLIARDFESLVPVAAVLFGIFAAFCMFRFLWSRRESVLYLSVGTARAKQFLLRYAFGLVSVVVGILVPFAITHYATLAKVGDDYFGICAHYTTVYVASLLLIALLSYTVAVLVSVLCGSFLTTLLCTAGILSAPYAVLWGSQTMLRFYLFGTPLGEKLLIEHLDAGLFTMFREQLAYAHFPKNLLDYYAALENGSGFAMAESYRANMASLPVGRTTLLLVLMLALAVLAGFAYCRRPAEHAGKATVHPILSHAVAIANGFCIASLVLLLKAPAEGFWGTAMLTALFVLAIVLASVLLRLALTRDPKGSVKQWFIPCGASAVGLVMAILLGTGWFGYATYLPDPMDVQSVTVTYNQNVTLLSHLGQSGFSMAHAPGYKGIPMSGTNAGTDTYYHFLYTHGFEINEDVLPVMTHSEDIATVLAIHEAVITDGRQTFTGQPADAHAQTVVPVLFRVTYTLKNGKTVERYYEYLTLETLEQTVQAENTHAIREEIANSHAERGFADIDTIELGDPLFASFTAVDLSDRDRQALIIALDTDKAAQISDARYFSDEPNDEVIGIVRMCRSTYASAMMDSKHPSDKGYETYYVTASWENTMSFLRERELDACFESEYTVTDVRYQRYTPRCFLLDNYGRAVSFVFFSCENTVQIRLLDSFDGMDIKGSVVSATDPVPADMWDAYLDASRPVALMTRPGVLVQIILTNQKGEEKLVTRYLYDQDLPE